MVVESINSLFRHMINSSTLGSCSLCNCSVVEENNKCFEVKPCYFYPQLLRFCQWERTLLSSFDTRAYFVHRLTGICDSFCSCKKFCCAFSFLGRYCSCASINCVPCLVQDFLANILDCHSQLRNSSRLISVL